MNELILAKISSWASSVIFVVAGSCYAFISGNQELTKVKSWLSFVIGTFIAFVMSKAAIERFHIEPLSFSAYSIQIIAGLFMIQVIGEAFKQIPEAFKQIPKILDAIRTKWLGS